MKKIALLVGLLALTALTGCAIVAGTGVTRCNQ